MDLMLILKKRGMVVRELVGKFVEDVRRLFRASPLFCFLVLGTGIILGAVPMMFWIELGKFIDAAFGARGIGTVTSDLTRSASLVGVAMTMMVITGFYFLQTKALSRQLIVIIATALILVTHLYILFPVTKAFLVFLCILALAFHIVRQQSARIVMGGVLLLLSLSTITDILFMMTRRSFTVGMMIEYSGTILLLSVVAAFVAVHRMKNCS